MQKLTGDVKCCDIMLCMTGWFSPHGFYAHGPDIVSTQSQLYNGDTLSHFLAFYMFLKCLIQYGMFQFQTSQASYGVRIGALI